MSKLTTRLRNTKAGSAEPAFVFQIWKGPEGVWRSHLGVRADDLDAGKFALLCCEFKVVGGGKGVHPRRGENGLKQIAEVSIVDQCPIKESSGFVDLCRHCSTVYRESCSFPQFSFRGPEGQDDIACCRTRVLDIETEVGLATRLSDILDEPKCRFEASARAVDRHSRLPGFRQSQECFEDGACDFSKVQIAQSFLQSW